MGESLVLATPMRIAVAVVVGFVLLSVGHVARAEEAKRPRNENCLDSCNFAFEKCQAREGVKPTGRCHTTVVKCKQDCPFEAAADPTAPPTEKSHQKCVDACRDTYKKCLGRAENKRGGRCQADDVRCEQACPKPPPEMVEVPASEAVSGAPAGNTPGTVLVPVPVPTPAKRRAARVEGAAAPAPVSATPAAPVVERPPPPATSVRSEGATPPETAPAESSAAGARPAQAERGFFGKLGCFFVSCDPPGSTACLKGCAMAYDECHALESKRGGECSTRLMHCRRDCSDAAALKR